MLVGGPALILNTPPRFGFFARKEGSGDPVIKGIPEGSPAATWLNQRRPLLEGWAIDFHDPHERRGGFGASGAQFLFAHTFTTRLQGGEVSTENVFNDFQVCSQSSGSGADILALLKGGVSLVNCAQLQTQSLDWAYSEVGFAVLRTGSKLPTHLHLASLDRERLKELIAPAESCAQSYGRQDVEQFVMSVREFSQLLRRMNLQSPRTLELLAEAEKHSWCLAAKGCGAWGADTILVLFDRAEAPRVQEWASGLALPLVAHSLSGGLEVVHEAH